MAYEDLIRAVEASAEEQIREIRQRAESEAEEILEKSQVQSSNIVRVQRENAAKRAEIEQNRILSGIRAETKLLVIQAKAEVAERAFSLAEQELTKVRERSGYEAMFRKLLNETLLDFSGNAVKVHINERDEELCRRALKDLGFNSEVIPDLHCAGGLSASTSDGTFLISNTIESRLERARELLRPEVFTILYGG
ncbi:MAG: V-type proton ATPase subunit E [Methanoregulaceae archaeon]|nr:V-type proton ATPase subunit E [Methanoregulaceae archaeon]